MKGKLFTAGPVNPIKPGVLFNDSVYMRTDDFRKFTSKLADKVLDLFYHNASNDYRFRRVAFVACSGTGVMQMAVENADPDNALVISNGHFGDRFIDILDCYCKRVNVLKPKNGYNVTYQELYDYYRDNRHYPDVVFATYCESSTGQLLQDIDKMVELVHEHDGLFVLDAVSGAVVNNLDLYDTNVDVVITTSQKGFGVDPGLSMILYNTKMITRSNQSKIKSYYFDLLEYDSDMYRGSTPFTPPVSLMHQLDNSLNYLLNCKNFISTCSAVTKYLREEMKRLGFRITTDEHTLGNCITEFYIPTEVSLTSEEITEALINGGYYIVPDSDDPTKIRVGNFSKSIEEVDEFISCMEAIISRDKCNHRY